MRPVLAAGEPVRVYKLQVRPRDPARPAFVGAMFVDRRGGDIAFVVEELKAVFDPRGGYLKKGGVYMPSIVAEIGGVLERHLIAIGMLEGHALDETQLKYLAEKRAAYEASQGAVAVEPGEGFPAGAQLCNKCSTQAVVQMDGCATCLNCGNSKCG